MTDEYLCNNISASKSKRLDARLKTINEFGCLSDTKKSYANLLSLEHIRARSAEEMPILVPTGCAFRGYYG